MARSFDGQLHNVSNSSSSYSSGEEFRPNRSGQQQIQAPRGGHGRGRGRRRGRGRGRGHGHGRGREGGRSHEEEAEEVTLNILSPESGIPYATNSIRRRHREGEEEVDTMVTSRPRIDSPRVTNSTRRIEPNNSYAPDSEGRPEIDSSHATNYIRVFGTCLRSQIEGGTSSEDIMTLDDINFLKCPICSTIFSKPVFQCVNGHPACSGCCGRLGNKCPSCSSLIHVRCLVMEKCLDAVKTSCLNSKYGCKERVSYSMKHEHERSCAYEPCSCPLPGCGFDGSYRDLYLHFTSEHSASATRFTFDSSFPVHMSADMNYKFLQERDDTLFVLNYNVHPYGYVADVICMGPSSMQNNFLYDLEASNIHRSVKATSLTQSLPKWTAGLPENPVLVVTKDVIDSSWDHKIQVRIHRNGQN